jgi:putative inorganic carbon (HCO3(-)) transporter
MLRRLLWIEPFWLLGLAPWILFPGRLLPVAWQPGVVLALFAFWPLRWLHWRIVSGRWIFPLQTPISLAVLLILLWLPVNIWAAVDAVRAWESAGYLLIGVALFVALVNWPPTQRHPQRLAWLLIGFAGALALVGPLLMTGESGAPDALLTLQQMAAPLTARLGETINPNILANALLVVTPLPLALALRRDWTARRWLPWLLGVIGLFLVGVIVLTRSRGSLLALGAMLPLLFVLRYPRLLAPMLLAFLVGGAFAYWLLPASFYEDLFTTSTVGGLDERIEIWSRALYAIQDFTFTGVGIGAFDQVIPLLYPYFLISPNVTIPDAHNHFLQVAIDLGIPGLLAYVAIILTIFWMLGVMVRARQHALRWALASGLLASYVGLLVGGVFSAINWSYKLGFLSWLLLALSALLYLQHCRQAGVDAAP